MSHNRLLAPPALLLAATSMILAGCFSSPAAVPTPTVPVVLPPEPTTLAPIKFGAEIRLGPGLGEPNIALGPNGTVYVTPVDHLYRSVDGGKTFEDLGTQRTRGHGDGDIAIDASGRLHWLGLGGGIPYQYSDDLGESFTDPFDVSERTGNDREWLDVSPDGHVYAAWRDNAGYVSAVSLDGGETWEEKVRVMGDALGGPIIHDPSNGSRLFIPYVTFGQPATLGVARSEDEGLKWKTLPVFTIPTSPADIFSTSIFPVLAIDTNGTLYMVVSMRMDTIPDVAPKSASQFGVFLFVSSDHGKTWTDPQLLSPPDRVAVMPWIVAGKPGRVAAVWYENAHGIPSESLPDLWNVKLLEGLRMDGAAAQQVVQIVQVNGEPNHIGSVCTSGTLCVLGGDRSLLDFFEVALSPEGQPAVAWGQSVGGTGISGLPVIGTQTYTRLVTSGTPLL